MADLSVTAANVHIQASDARTRNVTFGEAVTAGQACYVNDTDGKYYRADADASETAAAARGIALVGAAAGSPGVIVEQGKMDIGATLTIGMAYMASTTAGGIAPITDFSGYSGAFLTHLGYATAADTLDVQPLVTGASN